MTTKTSDDEATELDAGVTGWAHRDYGGTIAHYYTDFGDSLVACGLRWFGMVQFSDNEIPKGVKLCKRCLRAAPAPNVVQIGAGT